MHFRSDLKTEDLAYIKHLHEADLSTRILGPKGKWIKLLHCPKCPLTFTDRRKLLKHGMKHVRTKNYTCSLCTRSYKTKYILTKHMKEHNEQTVKYRCDICGKEYFIKYEYEIHIHRYPPSAVLNCPKCPNRYHKQRDYNLHLIKDHDPIYKCFACKQYFDNAKELKEHAVIHKNRPGTEQCEFCGIRIADGRGMENHLRTSHLGVNAVWCHICGKRLSAKTSLKEHVLIHTGERPLTCEWCNKTFAKSAILLQHKKTHTGEKFKCTECNKSYTQRNNLKIHMRKHTGERPYHCELCADKFTSKTTLNLHRKSRHKIVK